MEAHCTQWFQISMEAIRWKQLAIKVSTYLDKEQNSDGIPRNR